MLLLFTLDMLLGPADISAREVVSALWHPSSVEPSTRTIVMMFRLPTAFMAICVGASLGISGAQMQTILNNPLASPFTLGVSAAASFGAALILVFGTMFVSLPLTWLVPFSAFVFALLGAMSLYALGSRRGGSTETIVVGGVAIHFLFSSAVAFLQFFAAEDTLQAIVFWIFGTLQGANWTNTSIVAVVLFMAIILLAQKAWQLTSLRLGDEHARSLGVDVARLKLRTLVIVSTITATAVCFTGAIGFVGLVAPHVARRLVGEDQRFYMPLAGLLGGTLVSTADIVSKSLVPETIFPIGIVTAAMGAPFLAVIALGARRSYW
ncbi:FecCD family ABC transporter permease [Blastopirellula marina]|nr:iron ABC transporter permease [Blastopirellula marina]